MKNIILTVCFILLIIHNASSSGNIKCCPEPKGTQECCNGTLIDPGVPHKISNTVDNSGAVSALGSIFSIINIFNNTITYDAPSGGNQSTIISYSHDQCCLLDGDEDYTPGTVATATVNFSYQLGSATLNAPLPSGIIPPWILKRIANAALYVNASGLQWSENDNLSASCFNAVYGTSNLSGTINAGVSGDVLKKYINISCSGSTDISGSGTSSLSPSGTVNVGSPKISKPNLTVTLIISAHGHDLVNQSIKII